MLKRYRNKFPDDLLFSVLMHPSNWAFSGITRNVTACFGITGVVVCSLAILNGLLGATVATTIFMFIGFIWYGYVISVLSRSSRILRRNYNEFLYPIEVAYNSMRVEDQKKYSSILSDAYTVCARRNYDEFAELEKIRELFELAVPDGAKPIQIDTELAIKRKELKEKKDLEKMQQSILDELR